MSTKKQRLPNGDRNTARPDCHACKHLIIWPYCFAFMSGSGIPREVREGELDHTTPLPGDHGLRFLHEDSPYELSESALKEVIAMYKGETIMERIEQCPEHSPQEDVASVGEIVRPSKAPASLMAACIEGNIEAAKEFLAGGADIDARDSYGNTPLMHACRGCHLELVKLLLDSGCDIAATDKYSKQAIDIAEDWGYPTIVELLKKYGRGKR